VRTLSPSLAVVVVLLGLLPCCGNAVPPSPPTSSDDGDRVVQGATEFGLALYKEMAPREGNIVVSPLSVSIATAMLGAGAEGETQAEIAAASRFGLPEETLHSQLGALLDELDKRVSRWADLSFANGVWVDSRCTPLPDYKRLLAQYYGAVPETVRFAQEPEKTCARINGFVSERTRGKISSVVAPDMFSDLTRLVLANTVYFLAAWEHMFWEQNTKRESFHLLSGGSVSVDMMHRKVTSRYYEDDSVQVLELPYQGSGLAMLVVLPSPAQDLADLEARLTPSLLSGWVGGLTHRGVDIAIPRFEVSDQINLIPLLRSMGMNRAFVRGSAELPGLCNDPDLYVDLASHHATLGITEKGTEAAAATVYKATLGAEWDPDAVVPFRADRPFLFIVEDMERGTILFMGRLANPGD
jgi:serpin B